MSVSLKEIGTEYLDALADVKDARIAFETNALDRYDPEGKTKRLVTAEYEAAILRLRAATRALVGL